MTNDVSAYLIGYPRVNGSEPGFDELDGSSDKRAGRLDVTELECCDTREKCPDAILKLVPDGVVAAPFTRPKFLRFCRERWKQ